MPRNPNTFCSICNNKFYKRPGDKNKSKSGLHFCSVDCSSKHQTILKSCPECDTEFRAGLNKKYCSRSCANKGRAGIKYFTGQHKNKHSTAVGYRRMIVEQHGELCELCGYDKHPKILVVHHIVEKCNGGTNDLDNLQLICPNCHALQHYGKEEISAG